MNTSPPQSRSAAIICGNFDLSDDAQPLLREEQSESQFFALLLDKHLYADGIRFMAHRLKKREALWWGIVCFWEAYKPDPPPKVAAVLRAVVEWVGNPNESNRREAEKVAERAGLATPAGFLALAAFSSGGSLAPPKLPEVAPAPHLTGKFVAAALLQAAHTVEPGRAMSRLRQFLEIGVDVLEGKATWKIETK